MHAGSSKSNHACMDKYVKYSQPASCWTTVFLLFSCGSHSSCLLDLVWGLAEACCCTALNIAVRQLLWQCVALGHVGSPRRVACNFLSSEMAFLWHTSRKTAPHLQYRLRSEIAQTDKTMLGHLSNLSTCYTKAIECDCTALRRKVAPKQDVSVLANLQWQRAWYNELGNYIRIKRANNATLPPIALHTCVFRTTFRTLTRATHGPHGREPMRFVSRPKLCALHKVLQISRVSLPRAYVGWISLREIAEGKPRMWTPFCLTCLPQTSSVNMCERGLICRTA